MRLAALVKAPRGSRRSVSSLNQRSTRFIQLELVGIDAAEPGFSKIAVRPLIHTKIGRASAAYQSVKGPIQVGWEAQPNGRYLISLDVPPNTEAEVQAPGRPAQTVGPGRHRIAGRR